MAENYDSKADKPNSLLNILCALVPVLSTYLPMLWIAYGHIVLGLPEMYRQSFLHPSAGVALLNTTLVIINIIISVVAVGILIDRKSTRAKAAASAFLIGLALTYASLQFVQTSASR